MSLDTHFLKPLGAWANQAACIDTDSDWFTGDCVRPSDRRRAATLCASCPVRGECSDYATSVSAQGLWGGILRQGNGELTDLVAQLPYTDFWISTSSGPTAAYRKGCRR